MLSKQIVQFKQKVYRSKSGSTIYNKVRYGAYVAGIDPENPNSVIIGCSLCYKGDIYDDTLALKIAGGKACKWKNMQADPQAVMEAIPYTMLKKMDKFIFRCKNYFKDKEFPLWTENFEEMKAVIGSALSHRDKQEYLARQQGEEC